mgnify:CR=1 FL=1
MVINSTMKDFGESDRYIESYGRENGVNIGQSSLKNIPMLNQKQAAAPSKASDPSTGSGFGGGAFSGGSFY